MKQFLLKNSAHMNLYNSLKSKYIKPLFFRGSEKYWINRYKKGGNSGAGSYGKFAEFKAQVINNFLKNYNVNSVIEFGCGDGNQLKTIEYPNYLGFDVSPDAISMCKKLFDGDNNKKFALLNEFKNERAELTLSLDVIFHLVEDEIFESYMHNLFNASEKYVIIYSSNIEEREHRTGIHFKHRIFTDWVTKHMSGWERVKYIQNKYPFKEMTEGSSADFYIYMKKQIK